FSVLFFEKKEDFYRGFTSKSRQMPAKAINFKNLIYLLTFNSLSLIIEYYNYKIKVIILYILL
ncbi:MAG TPA: hypothetical protein H9980_09930, partial [Candidatus Erysipelatoclostridium merdavium]|nr:hypothetical protein [Candidatus Erysipelatoclostridium merdavium]